MKGNQIYYINGYIPHELHVMDGKVCDCPPMIRWALNLNINDVIDVFCWRRSKWAIKQKIGDNSIMVKFIQR